MSARPYRCGLEDLGNGLYAWMQPDGGWGWSNAGFVRDGDASLLVDTLFDEPLTAIMLAALRDATGIAPDDIDYLVNTHANGDHTHGNALVAHAEVIASAAAAQEMAELPPAALAQIKAAGAAGAMGEAGRYFAEIFAPFDFTKARGRAPTRTFERRLDLRVGDKAVELHMLGPAHTAGDVLAWVPVGPHRVHGRPAVHRRHAHHVGGAGRQLARGLRPDPRDGCREHRARPRSDDRRRRRAPRPGIPALRGRRGTPAL